MDRPISSCCASSSSRVGSESSGVSGMGGSEGWAQTEMNSARPTRTRIGTLRWLKIGMPANSASERMKGHNSGFSQASSWASVTENMSALRPTGTSADLPRGTMAAAPSSPARAGTA